MARVIARNRGWAYLNKGMDAAGEPIRERCRIDAGVEFDWDATQGKVPSWCDELEAKVAKTRKRPAPKAAKKKATRASDTVVSQSDNLDIPGTSDDAGVSGFEQMAD